MRMLVVNDNRKTATAQAMMLSGKGFTVETSFAVEEAKSRLESASYDVVIVNAASIPHVTPGDLASFNRSERQMCYVWITKSGVVIQGDGRRLLSRVGKKELQSVFALV